MGISTFAVNISVNSLSEKKLYINNSHNSNKRKRLYAKRARSRSYPAETITEADYADVLAFLANTPAQAESLLHSLEQPAGSIDFYVNANIKEYMCLK